MAVMWTENETNQIVSEYTRGTAAQPQHFLNSFVCVCVWACVDVSLSNPELKKFHSLTQHDECLSILYVHDWLTELPSFFFYTATGAMPHH